MRSIGIDIGSSSIKVVEVQSTNKSFQLTQYFEFELGKNQTQDQSLEIIDFLRNLAERYADQKVKFVAALRQDQVSIRNKTFPFSDRIKISRSLAFELEDEIPFSSESAIFDAKIIRFQGNSADVLACAAPKSAVSMAVNRFTDSNIDLDVLSVEGLAYANILENWQQPIPSYANMPIEIEGLERPVKNLSLLLHLGFSKSLLCAYEGSSLVAVRGIQWGSKMIAEQIAKKYNLPFKEAVKEVELKAFILTGQHDTTNSREVKVFSDLIAGVTLELVKELQLSLLEIKSEFNAQILRLDLTGGPSNIRGLSPFLTQNLEIPVNKLAVLDLFANNLIEKTDKTQSQLAVAIGLAIEGLKKPKNPPTQFLRHEFAKQDHQFIDFWEKWGHTLKIATAGFFLFFVYSYLRDDLSLSLLESGKESLKKQAKTVANIKKATDTNINKYIKDNKKRTADLKKISSIAKMNSALVVLKKINDGLPSRDLIKLDVQKIHIADKDVFMEGYVGSAQELESIKNAVKGITIDGVVQQRSATLSPQANKTSFALGFKVDRGL